MKLKPGDIARVTNEGEFLGKLVLVIDTQNRPVTQLGWIVCLVDGAVISFPPLHLEPLEC